MKIRTDFVTNSSSNSFTCIVIDNPLLLEILQKYKDMGIFGDFDMDMAGSSDLKFSIGSYETIARNYPPWEHDRIMESDFETASREFNFKLPRTPAFFLNEDVRPLCDAPKSLDEVLRYLIDVIDWNQRESNICDLDLYKSMREELQKRGSEIKNGYLKIVWYTHDDSDETVIGDEINWEFSYDPENGEKYTVSYYEGEES